MMASRIVKKHELERVLNLLASRGTEPACLDLIPGGFVRVHLTPPVPANDTGSEAEAQAWEKALS